MAYDASIDGTDHGHYEKRPVAGDKGKSLEKDTMDTGCAGEGKEKEKERIRR